MTIGGAKPYGDREEVINSPSLILVLLKLYEVWEMRSLENKPAFKLPYFGVA